MKCDCIGATVGHHTQGCLDLRDLNHRVEEPRPLALENSTTYNSMGVAVTVGLSEQGDIYESYIGSPAEARKLAKWLIGWSEWKEAK